MPKKQLFKELKKKLLKEKEGIKSGLKDFSQADPKLKGDFDTSFPNLGDHPDENADEVEEYENKLHLEHILELRLSDINSALEKIEKGDYGICEKCGKEIDLGRLKAIPEAKTCLSCAKRS